MNTETKETKKQIRRITDAEIGVQYAYMARLAERNDRYYEETGKRRRYYIETFGCQQNEADSERLAGMCAQMGYAPTEAIEAADIILINTCAVREHAEKRAFSAAGRLKKLKEINPELLIGICGCMVSQEKNLEKVRRSYPYVSFLFGTSMLWRLPEIVFTYLENGKRQFCLDSGDPGNIAEGLPVCRADKKKAWVSIMYGCNNFCTYCIVPYVRGRERSREPADILSEIRGLIAEGYKEITLLGQNVNSYGKDLTPVLDFPDLLRQICALDGDFKVHFMTSHPKDASRKLIDVMASEPKMAHRFHLPLQSGSDRLLKAMNRHYDKSGYLATLSYLREKVPDVSVTSDIIVGFPGETDAEFEETIAAVKEIGFDQVYTFIYSPRSGTPAAVMDCQIPDDVKQARYQKLADTQNAIARERNLQMIGQVVTVLVEGHSKNNAEMFSAHTEGGKVIHFAADENQIGTLVTLRITEAETFCLTGEIIK